MKAKEEAKALEAKAAKLQEETQQARATSIRFLPVNGSSVTAQPNKVMTNLSRRRMWG